ncbi:hypothetical protein DSO57_1037692 [Entomophthora muscae]|uniref:Uncharacterized protein n=1 Tax=Entomophthora muscae TaxID=34485 RepID=A0ACC2TLA5_9FUNG|nr:hypothetical protein DSO57_1037692 [Entomophthora muscae]
MFSFVCFASIVAAIPHTTSYVSSGGSWQNFPQQGLPWMNFPQQGSPWQGFPQQGSPWDTPQQGSPWEKPPQGNPWENLQPGNPQNGSPTPDNGSDQGGVDINDMLMQVNRVRAKTGARALRINDKLMTAAQRHSQDQANSRQMSHTGSDGSDISTRVNRVQYQYRAIAENVAYNQRSVSEVMTSWINSPGHYANLINPQYQDFGAGMSNYYWTQNFGTPQ